MGWYIMTLKQILRTRRSSFLYLIASQQVLCAIPLSASEPEITTYIFVMTVVIVASLPLTGRIPHRNTGLCCLARNHWGTVVRKLPQVRLSFDSQTKKKKIEKPSAKREKKGDLKGTLSLWTSLGWKSVYTKGSVIPRFRCLCNLLLLIIALVKNKSKNFVCINPWNSLLCSVLQPFRVVFIRLWNNY